MTVQRFKFIVSAHQGHRVLANLVVLAGMLGVTIVTGWAASNFQLVR